LQCEAWLANAAHNDDTSVAGRLDNADPSIDGIDDHSRHLVFFLAVRSRHHNGGADCERISHGTSERLKVPVLARRAVTGLTRAAANAPPN
jgi:hypothetical protein